MKRPFYILPLIVLSQFAGTSLWFVVNPIIPDILQTADVTAVGNLTSVIQFGFITGTLVFAILSIADRYSPSKIFFFSSLIAATSNALILLSTTSLVGLYVLRFLTGFFLAGIYPVGMKIAADWFDKNLGKALGYLVGALVLGTAFPHLLKSNLIKLEWQQILLFASAFALIGGLFILSFVGDGPYRKSGSQFRISNILDVFKTANFRSAAFGYFGHMWELYTFWSFVPIILLSFNDHHPLTSNISMLAFSVIAIGSLGCVAGGYLSQKIGSVRVAFIALLGSGACCILSLYANQFSVPVFYLLMMCWGVLVITDSPQFSTLVVQIAPPENKGTAITIVTCIGFALTIASIQITSYLLSILENKEVAFALLSLGPLVGLISLRPLLRSNFDIK